MRARIVATLALVLGVMGLLTFALSMVRPDFTGGRAWASLPVALILIAYWNGSRKKRIGAGPPPETDPGP